MNVNLKLLAGERKTLTIQFDDELAEGETLTGPITVAVRALLCAGAATDVVKQTSLDTASKNVLLAFQGDSAAVIYELRILCPASTPNHVPGRLVLIEVG